MQGESADEKNKTKHKLCVVGRGRGGERMGPLSTSKTLTERGEKKVAGNLRVGWDGERHCV